MKMIKKVIYLIALMVMFFVINPTVLNAVTTVKVTTDTLNLRKKASTQSDIVTLLSQGDTCELIEEKGDWYKIKYKNYTGYVSKEYVKKNGDSNQKADNKSDTDKKEDSADKKDDNKSNSDVTSVNNTGVKSTGKIAKKTDVKIVPLIYSSKIGELAKNTKVTIFTEMNGWAYIETNTINGWIRNENISGKKIVSASKETPAKQDNKGTDKPEENNQGADNTVTPNAANDNQQTNTEKTMYVAESAVNVRKEANTSSKIMMELAMNTKLTVIGENGEWYKVKTSEGNGYVLKKLLSNKQKTTSRGSNLMSHVSDTDEKKATAKESDTKSKVEQTVKNTAVSSNKINENKTTSTKESLAKSSSTSIAKGKEVVEYAKKFLGVKYVYGGASKSGFDCSGFTMYVYKKFGISMRHGAQAQAKIGKAIKTDKKSATSLKNNLQPGDLVFFLDYETMDEIGHCGIYIGDGKFIHASSGSGYCVKINSLLPGEYYNKRYCAARRVL